ncbi:DNA-directed RNA polymerase subunit omega [Butyricicoccus sp.]|uniref:DNA-directed RNA polymerase subunit omega n=1 Tax=Butyricicoccus sp. TaxID=2049021 RepID=UPI003F187329
MLKPSMQDLMKRVNNRYLLVNLAAQRARDISSAEEESEVPLEEKPIKIALDEICEDKIEYRPGPKPQPEPEVDILAAMEAANGEADDLLEAEDEDEEEDEEPADAPLEEL